MRRSTFLVLSILPLSWSLAGCTSFGYPVRGGGDSSRVFAGADYGTGPGNYYVVDGRRYDVMTRADGYREVGMASWYGPGFHGRPTSSGEVFDQDAMTAAHRTLPLGTRVRVNNLENGRTAVVRINDRGPFRDPEQRIIDLSRGAAEALGVLQLGLATVEVVAVGEG